MSKTILIVDDSESIRELLRLQLELHGYKVLKGVDGQDAVHHLNGQKIDLVITDLIMPRMDGVGLILEIRKNNKYAFTPVLVLTTESQAAKKEEAKVAGATGWIGKPIVTEKLLEVIKKIIR